MRVKSREAKSRGGMAAISSSTGNLPWGPGGRGPVHRGDPLRDRAEDTERAEPHAAI